MWQYDAPLRDKRHVIEDVLGLPAQWAGVPAFAELDADTARQAQAVLLTPVLKTFLTDNGFPLASDALQLFGGHGYTHDWGIEQCVRDARIAMICEGTNPIQAIDLVVRASHDDAELPLRVADELLRATTLVLIAHAWARTEAVSARPEHAGDAFHNAKRESAAHCFIHLRPELDHALAQARTGWQPFARVALGEIA